MQVYGLSFFIFHSRIWFVFCIRNLNGVHYGLRIMFLLQDGLVNGSLVWFYISSKVRSHGLAVNIVPDLVQACFNSDLLHVLMVPLVGYDGLLHVLT